MSTFLDLAFQVPWYVAASCASASLAFGTVLWEALRPYEPPTHNKPYDWSEDE